MAPNTSAHWQTLPELRDTDRYSAGEPARRLLADSALEDAVVYASDRLPHHVREDLVGTGIGYVRLPRHEQPVDALPGGRDVPAVATLLAM